MLNIHNPLNKPLHQFLGSAPTTTISIFNCRVNILLRINYRPNGRRQFGRPLKRLLGEAETGRLFLKKSLTRDGG